MLLALSIVAGCATPNEAARLTMCDVWRDPLKYQSREVIVSGWLSLSFEDFSFGCRNAPSEGTPQYVWTSFDMDAIARTSPKFVADLMQNIKSANAWKGGTKRNVVLRGVLKFSEKCLKSPNDPDTFPGFGHMGMSPGEIRVIEVIEYGPEQAHE